MKIQVRSLAIALAIAIAVAATANSSAVPINGTSIKAAVPAVTTDVRYRVGRGYPTYNTYWGYPAYSSYWGYPTYNSSDLLLSRLLLRLVVTTAGGDAKG